MTAATELRTGHRCDATQTASAGAAQTPDSDQIRLEAQYQCVAVGPNSLVDQRDTDAHATNVGEAQTPEQATDVPTPNVAALVRAPLSAADQVSTDAHDVAVGGGLTSLTTIGDAVADSVSSSGTLSSDSGHSPCDTHGPAATVAPTSPTATPPPPPIGVALSGTTTPPAPATHGPAPMHSVPGLADPFLALAADVLDDLERVRIANENRLRQLTRTEEDSDGEERGFGLTEDHPDVARLAALVKALADAEHQAELNLKRQLRKHPLGPWVKQARGVGEKQAARLLAAVGDPYFNDLHNRPRLVSELWSYCGYGDAAAQVRKRGEKANWLSDAKMRAHLVAVSIVKAGGPYREVYDAARVKYDGAVHQVECKRCGPAGKPAQPGSPISAGHQHARALRAVCKAVLRDLWREAKRLHDLPGDHAVSDAHGSSVAGALTSDLPGDHYEDDTQPLFVAGARNSSASQFIHGAHSDVAGGGPT